MPDNKRKPTPGSRRPKRPSNPISILTDILLREQPPTHQPTKPRTLILKHGRIHIEEGGEFAGTRSILHPICPQPIKQRPQHRFNLRSIHVGSNEGLDVEGIGAELVVDEHAVFDVQGREVVEGGYAFPEEVACGADGEGDAGCGDFGEGFQGYGEDEAEGGGAAAFEGPEEVWVGFFVGGYEIACCGDDVEGESVVGSYVDVRIWIWVGMERLMERDLPMP